MNNVTYLKVGKLFLATSITAIGIIHLLYGDFPIGLLPVPASLPGRIIFVYICGLAITLSGVLMLVKYTYQGALLAASILVALLVLVHVPKLIMNPGDGGEWTGTFEICNLFAGVLILASTVLPNNTLAPTTGKKLLLTGSYIFAAGMLVFGVLHVVYEAYIVTLIPAWFPPQVVWSYVVTVAFFVSAFNLVIQKQVRLTMLLLSLMFIIWVAGLHLPRVVAKPTIEPEWTSMFIALAMSGIALLIAGSADKKDEPEA
jgi:uncharacterized membrane protein